LGLERVNAKSVAASAAQLNIRDLSSADLMPLAVPSHALLF
jgi:hypothetical protein